ncbi:unnamed protein product [Dibothriocephalus latus]|uniref:Uncharacterized protein n=1 Tax=Dibothriocephalus latus TaxID=60516 RepID=A0A3P6TQK8_DIBLA|nr:unnamed protein product [Dibothriocephalus latus]
MPDTHVAKLQSGSDEGTIVSAAIATTIPWDDEKRGGKTNESKQHCLPRTTTVNAGTAMIANDRTPDPKRIENVPSILFPFPCLPRSTCICECLSITVKTPLRLPKQAAWELTTFPSTSSPTSHSD